jgi:hypothetical protein
VHQRAGPVACACGESGESGGSSCQPLHLRCCCRCPCCVSRGCGIGLCMVRAQPRCATAALQPVAVAEGCMQRPSRCCRSTRST